MKGLSASSSTLASLFLGPLSEPLDNVTMSLQARHPSIHNHPRFQQLKRFFHISCSHTSEDHWYSILEPLSSKLSADFSRFYITSTDVSVDEMIVRFSERSTYIVKNEEQAHS